MTEELFRQDGYQFEFEAKVVSVDDELVILDRTAFYPGGGGQVCDTGTINDIRVTEAFYNEKKEIVHRMPKNDISVGDCIWGSVDWERRLDLMMGHTGEHLLFGSLKKEVPELIITKIFISPESKYVVVNEDVDWTTIGKAMHIANKAIRENLTICRVFMSRNDPDLENKVRIKLDQIPEDEEISVVAIGEFDYSACSGIHVMETSELGMIFVDRKVSAGKDGVAIHFKVGNSAIDSAMDLANVCLQTVEVVDSKPEDVVKTVINMNKEIDISRISIKELTETVILSLKPDNINGTSIYSILLPEVDRKILTEVAEKIKGSGGVALLVSVGETVSAIMASGSLKIDCRNIITEGLGKFEGRGGGKPDFAQGGIPDPKKASELLDILKRSVKESLS